MSPRKKVRARGKGVSALQRQEGKEKRPASASEAAKSFVVPLISGHAHRFAVDDLEDLRNFLVQKRDFFLRLLENPNLLEHDSFSSLLLAVFHLTEELVHRPNLDHLTTPDKEHLATDIQRAYVLLIREWLAYMAHLQRHYPYLFSLALRTNPFDPYATPEIA